MKSFKILNKERTDSIERIITILLENRGIKTKKELDEFLNPQIEKVTIENVGIDISEIKKALELIKKTIQKNKAIIIYGDYDVDGVTGTAILWETLYSITKKAHPHIPHRIHEGYGLSKKGIDYLQKEIKNIGLIITVDNGIVAHEGISYAKEKGISIIITDHHTKGDKKLFSDSIIHTTDLCGAGVAYLFSKIIRKEFDLEPDDSHLELVALATVADLVPLQKHNRVLLKIGLEKLHVSDRIGIISLCDEAKIEKEKINTYHIGHVIAPRLNAAGRISHALDSLRLICTKDKNRAKRLSQALGEINARRQDLTRFASEKAASVIRSSDIKNIIFVEDSSYESGVIGLIASRLTEEFYRPSIAVSVGEEISKGSARSVSGVNIIELIRSCSDFLTEAGGHPMAAGFSIQTKKLEDFKKTIIKKAEEIDKKLFEREIKIDLEIGFEHIGIELYEKIQKLAPFGMGNPVPVFITRGVGVSHLKTVGKDGLHIQILLEKDGYTFKGILFNHTKKQTFSVGDTIDLVYAIEQNVWKDKKTIELKVKDFKNSLLS